MDAKGNRRWVTGRELVIFIFYNNLNDVRLLDTVRHKVIV